MAKPDLSDGFYQLARELYGAVMLAPFSRYERTMLFFLHDKLFGVAKARAAALSPSTISRLTGLHRQKLSAALSTLVKGDVIRGDRLQGFAFVKDWEKWKRGKMPLIDKTLGVFLHSIPAFALYGNTQEEAAKTVTKTGQAPVTKTGHPCHENVTAPVTKTGQFCHQNGSGACHENVTKTVTKTGQAHIEERVHTEADSRSRREDSNSREFAREENTTAPRPRLEEPAGNATLGTREDCNPAYMNADKPRRRSEVARFREREAARLKAHRPADQTPSPPPTAAPEPTQEPLTPGQLEFLGALTPEQRERLETLSPRKQAFFLEPHKINFDAAFARLALGELRPTPQRLAIPPEATVADLVKMLAGDHDPALPATIKRMLMIEFDDKEGHWPFFDGLVEKVRAHELPPDSILVPLGKTQQARLGAKPIKNVAAYFTRAAKNWRAENNGQAHG